MGPVNLRTCNWRRSVWAIVVPLSLVLILVLLYGLFNSLARQLADAGGYPVCHRRRYPGLVSYRLAVLAYRRQSVSFRCLACSVMNGILVITYYNQTRRGGMNSIDAMFHAAEQRMRPMLMTALSCVYRIAAGGHVARHRQRSSATIGNGGGWRFADRPDPVAGGGASAADLVPAKRTSRW